MKAFIGILLLSLTSNVWAAKKSSKVLCGVQKASTAQWLVKPVEVKAARQPSSLKGAAESPQKIYNLDYYITASNAHGVLSLNAAVAKTDDIIASTFVKANQPVQFVIPESDLQVICNSDKALFKVPAVR